MALHEKKYKQAILYLCKNLGGQVRGKKKLAKLLYYADFDYFEMTQKHLTGDTYKALPMGPVPVSLEKITKLMQKEKSLDVQTEKEHEGYIPTEVYKCIAEPDLSVFKPEERKMLDRVVLKYGHLNGKQLEDLTHAEAPYSGTKPNEDIFYELAFYRGTDFSKNDQ